VDFVVVESGADPPRRMQWGDAEVDRSLRYLKERFPKAEAWQVSAAGRKDYRTPGGSVWRPPARSCGRSREHARSVAAGELCACRRRRRVFSALHRVYNVVGAQDGVCKKLKLMSAAV